LNKINAKGEIWRGWEIITLPAVALAAVYGGYFGAGSGLGRDLVRDLRRLIERVHDGDGDTDAVKRLKALIKWNCQCNRHEIEQKVRDLTVEILNDWDSVTAFVSDPSLPPTNNDADPKRSRPTRRAISSKSLRIVTTRAGRDEGCQTRRAPRGVDTPAARRAKGKAGRITYIVILCLKCACLYAIV